MDAIDRQLIDLLRDNARLPYAELARKVGLSAPAVHERVGKLESAGVIRGYRADISPDQLGYPLTAVIGIVQDSSGDTEAVLDALREHDEIESCYFMAGEESFLCKARVKTIGDLERLIVDLNRVKGVARTRTTVALSTKWEGRLQAAQASDAKPGYSVT
jgi:Lrp/AsnC family leucine-responsive transcriptional regulator